MWEANVRAAVVAIIDGLGHGRPDWERMVYTVRDLAMEVGNQNLAKLVQPETPISTENKPKGVRRSCRA
jgi:hypothetical protein